MAQNEVELAVTALANVDDVMNIHIRRVGACALTPRMGGRPHFEQLARNIAYQQLAGRAAATIWGRVRSLVSGPFTAAAVLELGQDALRGAGLSTNKALSLLDLAAHVDDGRLRLGSIGRCSNDEVIVALSQVRGIGRWTAEMFLMFQLGRLDVWPTGDFGVRNGYKLLYSLPALPSPRELSVLGEKFVPYRSVAAWYCWRAVDTVLPVSDQ